MTRKDSSKLTLAVERIHLMAKHYARALELRDAIHASGVNLFVEVRSSLQWSGQEMAEAINIDPATLSRIENGRQQPSMSTMIALYYVATKELDWP